jgi:peptidyl-prolyl cis-trans isomerase A (cyclophilin A)
MTNIPIVIETELGAIEANLDAAHAPGTTANFLQYVDAGYYSGGRFHRTVTPENQPNDKVRIGVIQAGIDPEHDPQKFPPIPMERTSVTGLRHTDGALSMARREVDSAQSDFFICIGDQPELDFGGRRNPDGQGFAAFGEVTKGMEVVRKVQRAPRDAQRLTPPVRIIAVRRVTRD